MSVRVCHAEGVKGFDFEAARKRIGKDPRNALRAHREAESIPVADSGRYHLILTADGEPLMHGWWDEAAVAHRKFRSWVGEYGNLPGAHIVLVDKAEGEALASWPEPD